jgi:uncharacterized cupredoxin-like copper-binding protein
MFKQNQSWKMAATLLMVGVLVLTACSSSGSKNVTVNITVTEFSITSSLTTFTQGVAYHFVVKNNGSVNHEIRIMPPMEATSTDQQVQNATLVSLSGTDLTPGSSKSFDYTFTKAYPAGTLELACHLPSHYESGMHLPITVN